MIDDKNDKSAECLCPLLDLPCLQGREAALQCRDRVCGNFDPVARFADLFILQCAQERAAKMRDRTIKFLY